jgi:hypothetical protein
MGDHLIVEHVNEFHAVLDLGSSSTSARTTLRELERLCEALRSAGAVGNLTVAVRATDRLSLVAIVKDLPMAADPVTGVYRDPLEDSVHP